MNNIGKRTKLNIMKRYLTALLLTATVALTGFASTPKTGSTDNLGATTQYPMQYRDSVINGMPVFVFADGAAMPRIGLGTQWLDGDKTATIEYALSIGFRHLDTAHAYGTEPNVGEAVRSSGIPREQIWVTTKLWPSDYRSDRVEGAVDRMLKRLGLDYVDLLYIHHPYGEIIQAWPYLEKAVREGKVRHLGISNFELKPELIKEVFDKATIKPVIMQVECNPYAQRDSVQQLIKSYGMAQENWFPLGGPESRVDSTTSYSMRNGNEVLTAIGKAHGKTAVQVILRWHLQKGFSAVPGTHHNREHLQQNINVTDFTLSDDEMKQIDALNRKDFRFFPATYQSMSPIGEYDFGE